MWGAVGTLMSLDLMEFYREWTPKFRIMQLVAQRRDADTEEVDVSDVSSS